MPVVVCLFFASVGNFSFGLPGEQRKAVYDDETTRSLPLEVTQCFWDAQELKRSGDLTSAVLKYRRATDLTSGHSEKEWQEAHVFARTQAAAILMCGTLLGGHFQDQDTVSREARWDQAIREYTEVLPMLKDKVDWIRNDKMPMFYCTQKDALYDLAVLYELKGRNDEAAKLLGSLKDELALYKSIITRGKAGYEAVLDETLRLGDSPTTRTVKDLSPIAYHSLSAEYDMVILELSEGRRKDMLLHPEKYPVEPRGEMKK
jgi:tetratricopeptide (TPR) repeat protein